jgi:S-adenosylmethionine-diacylglycerol 3-amino-3-carboxypropyl transferase
MRNRVVHARGCSRIRYAQCWEDADTVLEALNIQPGFTCLSIVSGGDNTLAMLSKGPRKVFGIDLNAAQLALLELRMAAFRELSHAEMLALHGSVESHQRQELYERCRNDLSPAARAYWEERPELIEMGFGSAGRLERYFRIFRDWILPLSESRTLIEQLLAEKSSLERVRFYDSTWDNIRWRFSFRIFFSQFVMGRIGRDQELFRYAQGPVAEYMLQRMYHALTKLDPADNPYLHWILTGRHRNGALPFALRAENFDAIRAHLERIDWRCCTLEQFLEDPPDTFDSFNLSDVFENISIENHERVLRLVVRAARPNARLAYWNLLVPRSRPESLASDLQPLKSLADSLYARSKTFFYKSFVVEEVRCRCDEELGSKGMHEGRAKLHGNLADSLTERAYESC